LSGEWQNLMDSPRARTADYEALAGVETDRDLPRVARERRAVLALTPIVRAISRQEMLDAHS
jgi:hypothetical protein